MSPPSKQLLTEISNTVLDELTNASKASYSNTSSQITLRLWVDICRICREAFSISCSESFTEKLSSLCSQYNGLAEAITEVCNARKQDVHQSLLRQAAQQSGAMLKDFDWQLSIILGSDKLATIDEPMVSLTLDTHKSTQINVEMDEAQLDSLISTLETIDQEIKREIH